MANEYLGYETLFLRAGGVEGVFHVAGGVFFERE